MMTRSLTSAPAVVAGTEGYAGDAEWLIPRYESVDFLEKYRAVAHLFPQKPARILDVGAGTGADAGWLAKKGHQVMAVEPVAAFREAGRRLHPSPMIEWVDDSLPALSAIPPSQESFDLVLVSAVWHHLSVAEREQAMSRFAALVGVGRPLIFSIKNGPHPANRRVFDVSVEETILLAAAHHFKSVVNLRAASVQILNRQAGVTWSWLAFVRQLSCDED